MPEQQWARPFRITYPNGEVHHGVQFPSGTCVTCGPGGYLALAALSFDDLNIDVNDLILGAAIEWADGGEA